MNVERNGHWFGVSLLFLLGVLVLLPFLGTGFTTNDDAFYALQAASGSWKALVHFLHEESAGQGRFYKYFSVLLLLIPHYAHNAVFSVGCNLAAVGLNIVLAACLAGRLLAPRMGMLFALLFLALLQDHWGHSLLTAYPLYGQLGLTCSLLSWHMLLNWRCRGGRKRLLGALALFFLSLCCNELFVVFVVPGFLLCCMPRTGQDCSDTAGGPLAGGVGLLSVTLLYVALYVAYKSVFPGEYAGNSMVLGDFSAYWGVVKRFSISALPLTVFFKERLALSRYGPYFSMDTSALLVDRLLYQLTNAAQWKAAWIAQAGLAGLLFWDLLRDGIRGLGWKKLFWTALFGLSLVLAPNALLGLSEKYRQWVREGAYNYAYTYHSYYGVCILLTTLFALLSLLFKKKARLRKPLLALLALLLAAASFLTAYANDSVLNTKRLAAQRWELADALFDSALFHNLPNDTRIAAPTLFRCFRILCPAKDYWSTYAAQRTGKRIAVLDHIPHQVEQGRAWYFAELHQAFNRAGQFLTFADVQDLATGGSVLSSQVQLFIKTRARKVRIICPVRPGAAPPTLQNKPMRQIACGVFVADAVLDTGANVVLVTLLGNNILAEEVLVSDQFPYPALR